MNLGKSLINYLVNIDKEKGAYKGILNCSTNNTAFYQKFGFHESNIEMRQNI